MTFNRKKTTKLKIESFKTVKRAEVSSNLTFQIGKVSTTESF